ncbi:hypothetical protein BGW38_008960, partial [Lunasporangiospora selenospora]
HPHESTTTEQTYRSASEMPASSGKSRGVTKEPVNAAVRETKADDVQSLKRQAQEDAGKSKGRKSRKTDKIVQRKEEKYVESLQQRRTERFKCLDMSCFWVLRSSGRAVERVLFEASVKDGATTRCEAY